MNPFTQGSSVMQGLQEAWVWFQQDVMGIGFISVLMVMLMMAVVLTWVLRPSPIQPDDEASELRQEPAVSVDISSSGREAASSFWEAPQAEPVTTRPAAAPEPAPRTAFSGPLADEALELLVCLAEDVRALKQQHKDLDATINRHAMRIHAYDTQQTEIRQQLQRLEEARQAEALRQQAAALAEAAAARAAQPRYRQETVMPEAAGEPVAEAPTPVAPRVEVAKPASATPVAAAAPADDRQADYQQAMTLAANGVTVQDLMAQCGLSRPEAQLIVLLHGRGGQA